MKMDKKEKTAGHKTAKKANVSVTKKSQKGKPYGK
jgi:hypothetical protein